MSLSGFYERYWQREGGSPSDGGFALEERKTGLREALRGLPKGAAVLDAGCGNGEFSRYLSELGYRVSAVDISATAVERARTVMPEARFEVASLEQGLPFADGEFRAIWCTEVLEHLFEVHTALAELNRVLAPGGRIVVTTPYHGLVKNTVIALFGFERHYDPYISHIRFYTQKSLGACLKRAGFTPIKWSGVGRRWPLWMSHFVIARKASAPGPAPRITG